MLKHPRRLIRDTACYEPLMITNAIVDSFLFNFIHRERNDLKNYQFYS